MSFVCSFETSGISFTCDLSSGYDISIPVITQYCHSQDKIISVWGVNHPCCKPLAFPGCILDTRQGASCNANIVEYSPHTAGTHTECVGHVLDERISIHEYCLPNFHYSTLITVEPIKLGESGDIYEDGLPEDLVISASILSSAYENVCARKPEARSIFKNVVIRTTPNSTEKKYRKYESSIYFTPAAMEYLVKIGCVSLICDLPSVDSMNSKTLLSHKVFWGLASVDGVITNSRDGFGRLITELAFIANEIDDGFYVLNLQISPIELDAATSKPILYKVTFK